MEGRNVLLAVVLSTVVLVFWATFFEPPPVEKKVVENTKTESVESSTPSIEKTEPTKKISRTQAINNSERITIENAKTNKIFSYVNALKYFNNKYKIKIVINLNTDPNTGHRRVLNAWQTKYNPRPRAKKG